MLPDSPLEPPAGPSPSPNRGLRKIPLKAFALGLLWAGISATGPSAFLALDSLSTGQPVNWHQCGRVSLGCAGMGAVAYYRKYRALLQLPPGFEGALPVESSEELSV